MKASELIEKLHASIAELGDLEVEFHCDPFVPDRYSCRPAQVVGNSFGTVDGRPHKSILIQTTPEWSDEKVQRFKAYKAERDLELPAPMQGEGSFAAWLDGWRERWASRGKK